MRLFLSTLFALYFCMSQAQDDLIIPLKCEVQYINTGMAVGYSCTDDEIAAVDGMLEKRLSETLVALQHMVGLEELDKDANHIPCGLQSCTRIFHFKFESALKTDQENLVHARDDLEMECHSVLAGFANDSTVPVSCRNYLKASLCDAVFMIAPQSELPTSTVER
jgi:hypothetical protein